MRYLSLCSGIEAATMAWHPLGWSPVAFSEIEKFPSAVLAHHWPDTPNLGDMTKFKDWTIDQPIDLIVGGTPCQSFSIAGLRKGLADPRGNLALTFIAIARRFHARWVVWENVTGVLNANGGRDFATFIDGLAECGFACAWRVLDAQYFGVPQRRRRVFVVGYSGANWAAPAAVLFEPESLQGDTASRRQEGQGAANGVAGSFGNNSQTAMCLTARGAGAATQDPTTDNMVVALHPTQTPINSADGTTHAISTGGGGGQASVAIACVKAGQGAKAGGIGYSETLAPTLGAASSGTQLAPAALQGSTVRRLTPRECERLQGFPDDHTRIAWRGKPAENCPLGPRYKAIGNSMAVPVMAWLGQRIQMVDDLLAEIPDNPHKDQTP